jgi:hypothetical protein
MTESNRRAIRRAIHEAGEYADENTATLLEICRLLLDEIDALREKVEACK